MKIYYALTAIFSLISGVITEQILHGGHMIHNGIILYCLCAVIPTFFILGGVFGQERQPISAQKGGNLRAPIFLLFFCMIIVGIGIFTVDIVRHAIRSADSHNASNWIFHIFSALLTTTFIVWLLFCIFAVAMFLGASPLQRFCSKIVNHNHSFKVLFILIGTVAACVALGVLFKGAGIGVVLVMSPAVLSIIVAAHGIVSVFGEKRKSFFALIYIAVYAICFSAISVALLPLFGKLLEISLADMSNLASQSILVFLALCLAVPIISTATAYVLKFCVKKKN